MMGQPRRSFTSEFKQDAVDLCRRSGKRECQVAREVGLPQSTLNRWMRQAAGQPAGAKTFLAAEELKRLRRELDQVRLERDILKKSRGLLCQGVGMRYRLIQAEKTVYPVKVLCRILGVARSGFYARELCSKGHPFLTRQEARTAIFKYVEGFNKRARRHSMLGYLSPVEFEQRAAYSTTGVR